ncbi:glycoside hydrolase family 18 protein [Lentinula raphanica]|nr:glycoside hydrolase family 18 protein [Lentinula raphanica]
MVISASRTFVALLLSASAILAAFNPSSNTNVGAASLMNFPWSTHFFIQLVAYWGQNSYGAKHPTDFANWQTNLAHYCQDDVINVIPLAFLNVFFGEGELPEINFANSCSSAGGAFPGSNLANCQFIASDIQTCQAAGKIVTLSLGGATGSTTFTSASQAEDFADSIWNLFLGGKSSTRPFGNAVLDGIDIDIESGGSANAYFASFITRIRTLAQGASKPYYITGAPQCPYPDANSDMGAVLNAVGFDAVYVQFYNNFCEVSNYNIHGDWDFSEWDNWAKTFSPNRNVKVYIGAPASSTAAGTGYVNAATLGSILQATKAEYSSFGGAMLWDVSQAYANGRYDKAVKSALTGGSSAPTTTMTTTTTSTTTSVPSGGSCAGVSAWVSTKAYVGGSKVTYNGHLWSAKYWSEADAPGGVAGDWTDDGPCTTAGTLIPALVSSTLPAVSTTATNVSSGTAPVSSTVGIQIEPAAPSPALSASVPSTSVAASGQNQTVQASDSVGASVAGAQPSAASNATENTEAPAVRRSRFFIF